MARTASKVISGVLIVLLLVGAFGFLATYTDNFTTDFKTFYITYDGERILSDKAGLVMRIGEPWEIAVDYTFAFGSRQLDYHVAVLPNPDITDFEFTSGYSVFSFKAYSDYTECFHILKQDTGTFLITPIGGLSDILSRISAAEDIEVEDEGLDYFMLVISSADSSVNITLRFRIEVPVTGVSIEPTEVVFQ